MSLPPSRREVEPETIMLEPPQDPEVFAWYIKNYGLEATCSSITASLFSSPGETRPHLPGRLTAAKMAIDVRTKRADDPADRGDGYRVLIDHIWPLGAHGNRRDSMSGLATWRLVTNCAAGSPTIALALGSSVPAIEMS
jgi:hypothetical protein